MSIPSAVRTIPSTLPGLPSLGPAVNDIVPYRRGGGVAPGLPVTPRTAPPPMPSPGLPGSNDIVPFRRPTIPGDVEPPRLPNRAPTPRPSLPGSAVGGAGRLAFGNALRSRGRGAVVGAAARGLGRIGARGVPYIGWGLTAWDLANLGWDTYQRFDRPDTAGMPTGAEPGMAPGSRPMGIAGVTYTANVVMELLNYPSRTPITNGNNTFQNLNPFTFIGPLTGFTLTSRNGLTEGEVNAVTSTGLARVGQLFNDTLTYGAVLDVQITRVDGEPEFWPWRPEPMPISSPSPGTSPYPQPLPGAMPQPLPGANPLPRTSPLPSPLLSPYPVGSPLPGTSPFPIPSPAPIPGTSPVPGTSPYPSPLPAPAPQPRLSPFPVPVPSPPTPAVECCPAIMLELGRIRSYTPDFEASGSGVLDLAPCASEIDPDNPPDPLAGAYSGSGLDGIYDAIAAITKSLNLIRAATKCPTDGNAALPMFWEMKSGAVPQLVVIWRKITPPGEPVSGSTWSMTIPHPRADIGPDYEFSFPSYMKGGNMASMRLSDNSQCIVNAVSEPEAQKVLDYVTTLIDPAFIPDEGPKVVYSKGVADYAEVDVKAVYVKKFAGHKTTAPLWGRHID